MAIYKNDNGTWYVMIRYQDWTGARKQKCKRGFSTRKEAADWELQFKLQKKASVDMTMESFCTMYEEDGDYYLPDLAVNEEELTYGKYGMLRKQFLKVHRPARYQYLLMTGELTAHLNRVDQETREQVETLVKQMVGKQGVTEQLKMQDLMKWVGLMNNIKACAEEIVLKESIYM